jgi:transcriptional regulator with XRE-family HTH domain
MFVGQRVRERRKLLGYSQQALAELLGLTFQQVQKYESGGNRIGAGRLYDLANALEVPVDFFFDGAPLPAKVRPMTEALATRTGDPMGASETRRLVQSYYGIKDERIRHEFIAVAKALAGSPADAEL